MIWKGLYFKFVDISTRIHRISTNLHRSFVHEALPFITRLVSLIEWIHAMELRMAVVNSCVCWAEEIFYRIVTNADANRAIVWNRIWKLANVSERWKNADRTNFLLICCFSGERFSSLIASVCHPSDWFYSWFKYRSSTTDRARSTNSDRRYCFRLRAKNHLLLFSANSDDLLIENGRWKWVDHLPKLSLLTSTLHLDPTPVTTAKTFPPVAAMAYDWYSKLLYMTSTVENQITVVRLNHRDFPQRVLVNGTAGVHGIALDPVYGWVPRRFDRWSIRFSTFTWE